MSTSDVIVFSPAGAHRQSRRTLKWLACFAVAFLGVAGFFMGVAFAMWQAGAFSQG